MTVDYSKISKSDILDAEIIDKEPEYDEFLSDEDKNA